MSALQGHHRNHDAGDHAMSTHFCALWKVYSIHTTYLFIYTWWCRNMHFSLYVVPCNLSRRYRFQNALQSNAFNVNRTYTAWVSAFVFSLRYQSTSVHGGSMKSANNHKNHPKKRTTIVRRMRCRVVMTMCWAKSHIIRSPKFSPHNIDRIVRSTNKTCDHQTDLPCTEP